MTEKNKGGKKQTLVILDAHAVLHRAYHALPDFSSNKGEPTGALYGLSLMLLKLISDFRPDYLVACFDMPELTHRHLAYDAYKAGRKKTEEDLIWQLNKARDVFRAFNIPFYEKGGFEADDLIGTIVEILKDRDDLEIIIASGDMDTLNLVSGDKVKVYTLKKGIKDTVVYNESSVVERFGFKPNLLPDYKGLRGDPSDNIPGIPGIGEKTATMLIKEFGSIEEMYKSLKKDPTALSKKGFKKKATELILAGEEEALFSKMLSTIKKDVPIDFSLPDKKWLDSFEKSKTDELFKNLEFRTLGDRVAREILKDEGKSNQLFETDTKDSKEEISKERIKKASVVLWLIDSNHTNPTFEEILSFTDKEVFSEAEEVIFAELEKRNLKGVFEKVEEPLIPVIDKMEKRGIKIDTVYLKKLSEGYRKKLTELEQKIWKDCGLEFNLNSPKQLSQVLFENLKLKTKNQRKTAGGIKSTKESELEKIKDLHPVVPLILEYRELQKLLSTYIDNFPGMLSEDGRLRASFSQAGTTTGRLSSQNPNLQNIPIKTELGKKVRNAFLAEDNFILAAFDYSQIELRVAAFVSGEQKLIKIFKEGGDVHNAVASVVFGVPLEKVDYEMRRRAKVINFGILYGMGPSSLRTNLGTSKEEAQKFLDDYFMNFDRLAEYIEEVKAEARKNGYTTTLLGRRRYFPAIRSRIDYIRSAAERMAVNAPLQGTAADIIKLAMIKVDDYITKQNLSEKVFLILQVHD